MVVYNAATRELTAKIVYYGPGLGGKTTNLQLLHDRLEPGTVGKLLNLATHSDRTIYFDLLPVELGDIKGYKIRFQLATVPGQTAFNETRRVVLKGTDGIVFVADSQWTMLPKNLESWQNLKDNLKANAISFEGIPIVIQYNKRDLPDILSIDAMQEALGLSSYPFVEAVASAGRGVTETFKLISKLTFVDLLRRLQGRRPDDAAAAERRDSDDLQTWKASLLNRTAPPVTAKSRPLTLVPPSPEEAPFDMPEPLSAAEPTEGPFAEVSGGASPEDPQPAAIENLSLSEIVPLETGGFRMDSPMHPQPSDALEPEDLPEAIDFVEDYSAPPPDYDVLSHPLEIEEPVPMAEHDYEPAPLDPISPSRAPAMSAAVPAAAVPAAPSLEVLETLGRLESRLAALEETLQSHASGVARAHESVASLTSRLEAFERDARALGKSLREDGERFGSRLNDVERDSARISASESRLEALNDALDGAMRRQRTAEDDVSMALRSLHEKGDRLEIQLSAALKGVHEKGEKLDGQLGTLAGHLSALEGSLQEKTSQGRREADDIRAQLEQLASVLEEKINLSHREAEDIRQQLAPVLEQASRRPEAERELTAEFDRLRESLAESLAELSERLRRAVRGM